MNQKLSGLSGLSHEEISSILNTTCGCEHESLTWPNLSDDNLEVIIARLLKSIFLKKDIDLKNRELQELFVTQLWEAVQENYGKDYFELNYQSPDFHMLTSLQRDVVHFSSAKNYAMQKAIAQKLIDEEGKVRSFSKFQKEAFAVTNQHTQSWLRAEYDLAINSAQMASKWVKINQEAELFPLLQFDAVIDDNTTPICSGLNGVTRPIDDPFWDEYYPPNHFGCRSTARQIDDGEPTPFTDIVFPDNVPTIFKKNMAKSGNVFPSDHPYYTDAPDNLGELGLLRNQVLKSARSQYEGKEYEMEAVGKVSISWQGLKEIANQPHQDKVTQLQLMNVLPQLVKNSTYINSVPDEKGNSSRGFHNFSVNGLDNMFLVVREMLNGKMSLYSIVDKLK